MRSLRKRKSFKYSEPELDTIAITCFDTITNCAISVENGDYVAGEEEKIESKSEKESSSGVLSIQSQKLM